MSYPLPRPAPARYDDVIDDLRTAYDRGVERRDWAEKQPWKLAERDAFRARVAAAGGRRLLEAGAGTGQDSQFFAAHGFDVTAVDLSPGMVRCCRDKGLDARVMDLRRLEFAPGTFDAVYAMNCLLHVPNAELPAVLAQIRAVLRPGGLFFLGVYGGDGTEGIAAEDWHDPPRFFSWRTDDQLRAFAQECFDILDFHVVEGDSPRFQSLTLLRVEDAERLGEPSLG